MKHPFSCARPALRRRACIGVVMADFVVIVLGTGAVLLMAAYAELCGRI
jgi:hypothetical protein